MRSRLSIGCLLAAWLCANGALLDLEQAYAWARMFTGYVQTLPIGQAAALTLDPRKPCPICRAVQAARDCGAHQPVPAPAAERILFASQRSELVLDRVPARDWARPQPAFAPGRREAVRLRPPRDCA